MTNPISTDLDLPNLGISAPHWCSAWRVCCLSILLICGTIFGGMGFAYALEPVPPIGTVDPVAPELQTAHQLYVQNCGTCHLALPPAVLPSETWDVLIGEQAHYGTTLQALLPIDARLISQYLRAYSRPNQGTRSIPFRVGQSRYFRALHPGVALPEPTRFASCVSCHAPPITEPVTEPMTASYLLSDTLK
jgi:Dihaem cytochrome c